MNRSIVSLLFILSGCTLFEKNISILAKHKLQNGDVLDVCYVTLGATTNDVIQIRRTSLGKEVELVRVIEYYDYLESSKLVDDSLLILILRDTGRYALSQKQDTLFVKVK